MPGFPEAAAAAPPAVVPAASAQLQAPSMGALVQQMPGFPEAAAALRGPPGRPETLGAPQGAPLGFGVDMSLLAAPLRASQPAEAPQMLPPVAIETPEQRARPGPGGSASQRAAAGRGRRRRAA